ncbi:MAG: hypothetical protein QOJ40_2330, partial [Verrucomicrobiota bacterium]
ILGRKLIDPLDAWIRRSFVRAFLCSDLPRIAGIRYERSRLIAADEVLAGYFDWLQTIPEP